MPLSSEAFNMHSLKQALPSDAESDYENAPEELRMQLNALSSLQKQYRIADQRLHDEMRALQLKYATLFADIQNKRKEVVNSKGAGIENFWPTVLSNHPAFSSLINEHDVKALSHLSDICVEPLMDNEGFKITFSFNENEFFTNASLSKTYLLEKSSKNNEVLFDHSVGCEISWRPDMNLSLKTITKTQRHKSSGEVRVVKKTEEQETFFNYFTGPTIPKTQEEFDEIDPEELDEKLQMDYQRGEILRTKLIPYALDWFTGKAHEYEDLFDDEDGEEGCCDDSECEDSECERGEEPTGSSRKFASSVDAEKCKQQ